MRNFIVICVVLAACNGSGNGPGLSDGPIGLDVPFDGPGLALSSPVLTEGGVIDSAYTCNGANMSPQLTWLGFAFGTLSYAVVLTDKTNGLVHAVIYDIPGSATGLPANVERVYAPTNVVGAHQTQSYQPAVRGYNGPCPGSLHTYEFKLFAVAAATLPGATMTTTKDQAVTILRTNNVASSTLTGTYTP